MEEGGSRAGREESKYTPYTAPSLSKRTITTATERATGYSTVVKVRTLGNLLPTDRTRKKNFSYYLEGRGLVTGYAYIVELGLGPRRKTY